LHRIEHPFDTGRVTAVVPSHLREIADRARPVALAREQVLPVLPALRSVLPGGGLLRGATVGVSGEAAVSVGLALAAGASQAGSWVAVVGWPELGLVAAAELGVALERLVLIPGPIDAGNWSSVVAALVGAFDLVLVAPTHRVGTTDARRLAARSRERGSVVVQIDTGNRSALELDVRLATGGVRWFGLHEGHGHLRARQVEVSVSGRRQAARQRRVDLWLPSPDGTVSMVDAAPVIELAGARRG
jgi:hypothetical protein